MTRRSNSATSIPRKTLARSPNRLARKLWKPSILRSVRKHTREVIIALVLLIITLRLLLLLIIPVIMRVMGIIIIRYYFELLKENKKTYK